MATVARNSALNLASFGVASFVGLLVAPLIIGRFGIEVFGLVAVSRMILPSALGGLFDLGLPEAITRVAATDRSQHRDATSWRSVRVAMAISCSIGIALGCCLWFLAGTISTSVLELDRTSAAQFSVALQWTGIALVWLYPVSVIEGWLKGLEEFAWLRASDIAFNVVFGLAVWLMKGPAAAAQSLILLYLVLCVLRGVALAWHVRTWMSDPRPVARGTTREMLSYGLTSLFNKSVGIALRYVPQLMLGIFSGAAAVGLFEALSRIPYLAKSLLGVATSAILPAAARLSVSVSRAEFWARCSEATAALGAALVPGLVVLAAFGEFVLRTWLGAEIARDWFFFAIMMAWPVTIACDQVRDSMLSISRDYLRTMGIASVMQLATLIAVGIGFLPWLDANAFAVALCAAGAVGLGVRWRFSALRDVPSRVTLRPVVGMLGVIVVCALVSWLEQYSRGDAGQTGLFRGLAFMVAAWLAATGAYMATGMTRQTRAVAMRTAAALFRQRA
jgi:O-antigen/teichoic acid export membrane protein